jgi:hypothetical protein
MNFVSSFITLIEQRKLEVAQAMVDGNVVNFETYQRLVGQHQGLEESLNILNNLLEEQNRDVEH